MDYGITKQGFIRKPYDVILAELQAQARSAEYFGESIDLSDESFLGAQIKLMAWAASRQWELAEDTYYALDIDSAEAVGLDRLVRLGFIMRKNAIKARGHLTFTGGPHCVIPAGTQVETEAGVIFATTAFSITNESGEATAEAECITPGTMGNVSVGNITKIKTPVAGINSVTNLQSFADGRNVETDYELRNRFKSLPLAAGSSLSAIVAKIVNIESVIDAVGYENVENIEVEGIPPGAIEIIVLGGNNDIIAQTIFAAKSAGVSTFGNVDMTVYDSRDKSHIIRFSRPEVVEIYVDYHLSVEQNFDQNFGTVLKETAMSYVNSLSIAQALYGWKLCNMLHDIAGITNAKAYVRIGEHDAMLDMLVASPREIFRTSLDKVNILYE